MPSILTEASTWGATVTVPNDGEVKSAASINGAVQTLANRTLRLKNSTPGRATGSVQYYVPAVAGVAADPGDWAVTNVGFGFLQFDVSLAAVLQIPLLLPGFGTLTEFAVLVQGALGASHSGVPATKPTYRLLKQPIGSGSPTTVSSFTDASATAVDYDTTRFATTSSFSEALDGLSMWSVVVTGETGANSVSGGFRVRGVAYTIAGVD